MWSIRVHTHFSRALIMSRSWLLGIFAIAGCTAMEDPFGISQVRIGEEASSLPIELQVPNGIPGFDAYSIPAEGVPVSFSVREGVEGARYRFAVFYRNESYRFDETDGNGGPTVLSEENWYGCAVTDSANAFALSSPGDGSRVTCEALIRLASDPRREMPEAHWARDPRVGLYSVLLVAMPEAVWDAAALPPAALDIRKQADGHYIEPYWYWLHGPGASLPGVQVHRVEDALRLRAVPDLSKGVRECGDPHADLFQFIHNIDPASGFANVPVVADVLGNAYGPRQLDSTICFTPRDRWVDILPSVTKEKCSTVRYDSERKALELRNPGCADGNLRKENVGVKTTRLYTYGNFLIHAQLSPLLNDSDLWNGLTNAIWLMGTGPEGGLRRPCKGGYLAYGGNSHSEERMERASYAEIDFEIMKGMPLCPERIFPPIYPQRVADPSDVNEWHRRLPEEVFAQRGNVAVACTNWDLACPEPAYFTSGCQEIEHDGQRFQSFRWTNEYRAVTQKCMRPDDVLFGPDGYWFGIEWNPKQIIWRIGPSPEEMEVVSFMNDGMTSIPNVPMGVVVTQEFHNTTWWPGSPYEQFGVPFPEKDLVGRILEIRIE